VAYDAEARCIPSIVLFAPSVWFEAFARTMDAQDGVPRQKFVRRSSGRFSRSAATSWTPRSLISKPSPRSPSVLES